jgi:hypothetical protein
LENIGKKNGICLGVGASFNFMADTLSDEQRKVQQRVLAFEEMLAYHEYLSALVLLNQSTRLNALNLSALLAFIVGDVLTFLGTHQSWIFKQFTTWIMGGNGHLRSNGMIYCIKRNSSGAGLMQEVFRYILCLLAGVPGHEMPELAETLNYLKLSRITAPQIDSMASSVSIDGVMVSLPLQSKYMKFVLCDEFLRNVNTDAALNAMLVMIPRDADGCRNTIKTCDPSNHEKIRQTAVYYVDRGYPVFFGGLANNMPTVKTNAEQLKSLACVTHMGYYYYCHSYYYCSFRLSLRVAYSSRVCV